MNVKMLVRLFAVNSALLLWQGSQSTLAGNPPFPRPVQYPRDLAEVKKLGGFWKLSTEQQAYVRYRYVDELKVLMEDANLRMRLAQYTGDLRSCYLCRTVIKRLQESITDRCAKEVELL